MKITEAIDAARVFVRRRDRLEDPDGSFDSTGRWWPADHEKAACCQSIRSPSRHYRYSLLTHCRTARHIACLTSVPETEIRKLAKTAAVWDRLAGRR